MPILATNGKAVNGSHAFSGETPIKVDGSRQLSSKISPAFRDNAETAITCGWSPIPSRHAPAAGRPVKDAKRPIFKDWQSFGDRQMNHAELAEVYRNHPLAQINLACGFGGEVWIDTDTDNPEIIAIKERIIGRSTVARRGGKGMAEAFRVIGEPIHSQKLLSKGDDGKPGVPLIEIMGLGANVRIPPSMHPETGRAYVWLTEATVYDTLPDELPTVSAKQIAELRAALAPWLYQKPETEPSPRLKVQPADITERQRTRYQAMADKQFSQRIADLRTTKKGGRNRLLFSTMAALGVFIRNDFLKQDDVESAALEACKHNGLLADNGEKDVLNTIADGFAKSSSDLLPELKESPVRRAKAKQAAPILTVYSSKVEAEIQGERFLIWPDVAPNGEPKPRSQINIEAFLEFSGVKLLRNAFSCRDIIVRNGKDEVLEDSHLRALWLEADKLGMKASQKYFNEVVFNICQANRFNPVCDFLAKLIWDGKPRLDRWMSTYLGASDNALTRAQGAIHLIAAVRRARRPGCKYDTMIVLEGPQGGGKSTAICKLAGEDWFTDSLNIGDDAKIVLEQTADAWIVELAELAGIGKRDVESVKSFLSRTHDSARMSYDRCNTRRGRKFVCFATTNSSDYLIDPTGNRRFWPVAVGEIDLAGIERDRLQIWAEAAYREATGESITLHKDLWQLAAAEQSARVQIDPWQEMLESAIEGRKGKVQTTDIWFILGVDNKSKNPAVGKRIKDIMQRLGFKKDQQRLSGRPTHCYTSIAEGELPWIALGLS